MTIILDNISVAVSDLEAATAAYQAFLGRQASAITAEDGFRQTRIQLPNMALVLVTADGEGPRQAHLRARLADHGESIFAIGFSSSDLVGAARGLTRRGLVFAPVSTDALKLAEPASTAGVHLNFSERGAPAPVAAATAGEDAAVQALDHVVINTPNPDRAIALYGARIGLDFRLERSNPEWGSRLMFFKAGDPTVEIGSSLKNQAPADGPDRASGMAWRVKDPVAAQARLAAAGFDVSEVRTGRKPGTRVFTIRSGIAGAPSLMLASEGPAED